WRADFRLGRQNQKTGGVRAQAELDGAAKHSFAVDAAQFAFPNLGPIWQLRARQRQRHFVADFVVGRAANDLAFGSTSVLNFANSESISVWMTRRRADLRNDHIVNPRAACFDVFGLDTSAREQIRDIFGIFWKIDKFAEPINREFHVLFDVMSSEVETSLDFSGQREHRNSKRFLHFGRNDIKGCSRELP